MINKILNWLFSSKLLTWPRNILGRILRRAKIVILFYGDPRKSKVINLINKIKREREMLLNNAAAYQLFMAVKTAEKIEGEVVEAGVYKGASAKLICQAKGDKSLHLFDTFEGTPRADKIDTPYFYKGQYKASLEDVKNYLKNYKNVYFYKGMVPNTLEFVKDKKFSFVHLDIDIYESTLECLGFFYPRMNKGGIIICHDYGSIPGPTKAIDEFFRSKPEAVIEISDSQCLIIRL